MRVLIVSQYFHPENFRINQLALALKAQGHQLVVITGQPNYPTGQFFAGHTAFTPISEHYQGMNLIRVPIFPRGQGRAWELVLNYISFVLSAICFGLPRAFGRFDVCVAWCSSPITIAIPAIVYRFFTGTPVAIWVQDLWPETFFAVTRSRSSYLRSVLSALVRWIYRHVDQIWIQSPAYAESVRVHGGRVEQTVFVPNWAEDLYDCARWGNIEADILPEDSLVFAGNLGRAQGLETLLAAAELCKVEAPMARWVFVGDGVLRKWLCDEVKNRGLDEYVSVFPRRPASEMPRILKSAAAMLVTLGADSVFAKTIPSKVQSCLASGRPVLAMLDGEPAHVLKSAQNGFVTAPQDAQAFATVIRQFFTLEKKEREKLGANGHAYYMAHFTEKQVIEKITRLLGQMKDARTRKGSRK